MKKPTTLHLPDIKFLQTEGLFFFIKSDGERKQNIHTVHLSELGKEPWFFSFETDDIQVGIDRVLSEYQVFKQSF